MMSTPQRFHPDTRWTYPSSGKLSVAALNAEPPAQKTVRSATVHGKRTKRRPMQSVGWTINKLRFTDLGVYGRSDETEILEECLSRLCDVEHQDTTTTTNSKQQQHQCRSQLVWVSGSSGSGKSTLARTLQQPVEMRNGLFCTGKFDFQHRDQPCAGIIAACREIATKIVKFQTSDPTTYANIQQELLRTFASRIEQRCLFAISPLLGRTLGFQGATKEEEDAVYLSSYKVRWRQGICEFLRIVATFVAPLVLVLDDLQWADSESLEMIDFLMNNQMFALMIVCCYRSNEIESAHVLSMALRDMRTASQSENSAYSMTEISLGNLRVHDVNRILMDLLSIDEESKTMSLAQICHRRTGGNAFFLLAFVSMLKEEGHLEYSVGLMRWTWTDSSIERKTVATENVVDLIKTKMNSQLREATRRILSLAACLGTTFAESLIVALWEEVVSEESRVGFGKDPHELLEDAVNETFLELKVDSSSTSCSGKTYRWVHDRVQEAAMSLVDPKKQATMKYKAGITLAGKLDEDELESSIFKVCTLLNEGSGSVERTQRIRIAELNLRAAQKAMDFSAFSLAEKFAVKGIDILPKADCWEMNKELSLDLYSTATELENILGRVDRMLRYSRVVLEHPDCSIWDKLRVYGALIDSTSGLHSPQKAQDLCFEILRELGCRFPPLGPGRMIAMLNIVRAQKAAKDLDRIMEPRMDVAMDFKTVQEMKFLYRLTILTFQTESRTSCLLVVLRMVKLTYEKGFCEFCPVVLVMIGASMVASCADYEAGRQYTQFAMGLVKRFNLRTVEANCLLRTTALVEHWQVPFVTCLKPLLRSYQLGLQTGDNDTAMFAAFQHCLVGFLAGKSLDCVAEDLDAFSKQMSALKKDVVRKEMKVIWRFVLDLLGRSHEAIQQHDLNGSNHREDSRRMSVNESFRPSQHVAFEKYFKTMSLIYFGDYKAAGELAMERGDEMMKCVPGVAVVSLDPFYRALALLSACRDVRNIVKIRYRREAVRLSNMIKQFARKGNPNVLHQQVFIDAEFAALDKKWDRAKELYRLAAVQGTRFGILHEAALANERFGRMLLYDLKDKEEAKFQIEESMRLYSEWGAVRKVEQMLKIYADSLLPSTTE